ncbi:glycosyl hydrolase family 79 C-terminal domain-containing protein [Rugosimonospora africana]|uniref:Ricin B lectin domain-containing protein n=1 Tax=Rugosimonospora africana TaxID=556532 RepID=A0A8J3R0U4_9ACTN|nr:glycosyl hydrolase family 79 C-terminal domain-containing protein [Rugosimonospora africana]GIH20944.1 hypothetical protein Raf01_91160 [Rugosimonospora africana]
MHVPRLRSAADDRATDDSATRQSPARRSPARRSPARQSPTRLSVTRQSPARRRPHGSRGRFLTATPAVIIAAVIVAAATTTVGAVGASAAPAAPAAVPAAPAAVPAVVPAAPAATTAAVSIDPLHTTGQLPADYLGLSFEAAILPTQVLDSSRGNLVNLMRTLSTSGHLRFGGNSMDARTWWQPGGRTVPSYATTVVSRPDLDRLDALSRAAGWKVELGVNLKYLDTVSVADEAGYARTTLGSQLLGVECGNEPDLYAGYSYSTYLPQWQSCANAVGTQTPLIGPNWSGVIPGQFLDDEGSRLSFAAAHYYPLSNCGGTTATVSDLLSTGTATNETLRFATDVSLSLARGRSFRMDETNSSACGGTPGVSNVYASSLWSIEYLLNGAQQGVTGMNLHGSLDVCGSNYAAICATSASNLSGNVFSAAPLYYGMLMVSRLGAGSFLPVGVSSGSVKAYAVRGADGNTRVLLLDKDAVGGAPVSVQVKGLTGSGPATAVTMTGASLTAGASGIHVQGAQVGADGTIAIPAGTSVPAASGAYTVSVPTGSAVVLTVPTAGVTQSPVPVTGQTIVGQASGKCLDLTGNGTVNTTPVQLWTCNHNWNQAWTASGGALVNPFSAKCLDVYGAGTANGTAVQLWDCNGTAAQQWKDNSDGTIVNTHSGKCLDAVDLGTANGTRLQIWSCGSGTNQRWKLA